MRVTFFFSIHVSLNPEEPLAITCFTDDFRLQDDQVILLTGLESYRIWWNKCRTIYLDAW